MVAFISMSSDGITANCSFLENGPAWNTKFQKDNFRVRDAMTFQKESFIYTVYIKLSQFSILNF